MKANYPRILEPYKGKASRHRCPGCHKDGVFTHYIDALTGKPIHESVGKCERLNKCGYHYTPKDYFNDNNLSTDTARPKAYNSRAFKPSIKPMPFPTSFIPSEAFKASLSQSHYQENRFVQFLSDRFGDVIASELISRYFIGNSKHWDGSTVFWQIDLNGKIGTGKIMLYNPITGKRVKEPNSCITWVHKALKLPEYHLKQSFFGEHLLIDKTKPIAIVESEKSAIIASVYLPHFIWLASGGLDGLNSDKWSVLKGRKVILYPDLGGYERWTQKAKEISKTGIKVSVSEILEKGASQADREKGLDIADYLLRDRLEDFCKPEPILTSLEKTNPSICLAKVSNIKEAASIEVFPDINNEKTKPEPIPDISDKVAEILKRCLGDGKTKSRAAITKHLEDSLKLTEGLSLAYIKDEMSQLYNNDKNEVCELIEINLGHELSYRLRPFGETDNRINKAPDWSRDIIALKTFFSSAEIPTQPIQLNQYTTIHNIGKYLDSSFAILENQNGKATYLPELKRMQELKQIIELKTKA